LSFLEDRGAVSNLPRLVLDTNVVLDLFLFKDSRVAALAEAINTGRVAILTEPACVEEFRRVLRYPAFALAEQDQTSMVASYLSVAMQGAPVQESKEQFPLRCSDPDDQKFLELAWQAGADLVTRDKALLVLRRRFTARGGGTICTPESLLLPEVARSDITPK
jgi:putative PIN family toxin of toxin-antitoxin system